MGFCCRLIFLVVTISSAIVLYKFYDITRPLPAPKIDVNEYWGPGSAKDYKPDLKPMQQTIAYNDETIKRLRKKLNESVELHPPLEGTGFQYGMNSRKLIEFIDYWRDDYLPRWRERELYFNTLPHYLVNVQGLDIHFIHTKATYDVKGKKVIPLLLLHGWPGSVREFYEIIPKLALPGDELNVVFEIVAPSLPGYGWSDGAIRTGLGAVKMSVILRNLMIKLGYTRFYIQGGDWGSLLANAIATLFPENVIGVHSNMCSIDTVLAQIKSFVAGIYPSLFVADEYKEYYFPQWEKFEKIIIESGYFHIQATKPDTIGAALTANPIGLAAYLLEKFSTWTNPDYRYKDDGGFDYEDFTKDALLDNIMVYYLTGSITSSMRLYAESFAYKNREFQLDRTPTNVPYGCAKFKNEIFNTLDWVLKDKFTNLIHSTHHHIGGHFAAMEQPELLYSDFVEFVKKVEK